MHFHNFKTNIIAKIRCKIIKVLTRLARCSDKAQYSDIRLSQYSDNNIAQCADNHHVQCSDNLDLGLVFVGTVVPSWLQSLIMHNTIEPKNV